MFVAKVHAETNVPNVSRSFEEIIQSEITCLPSRARGLWRAVLQILTDSRRVNASLRELFTCAFMASVLSTCTLIWVIQPWRQFRSMVLSTYVGKLVLIPVLGVIAFSLFAVSQVSLNLTKGATIFKLKRLIACYQQWYLPAIHLFYFLFILACLHIVPSYYQLKVATFQHSDNSIERTNMNQFSRTSIFFI